MEARPRIGPGVAAGVSEETIRRVVHAFYARVRQDPVLGPVFNGAIHDWPAHLDKLCDFWSSVLLMTGRFKGRPMPVHVALPDNGPERFARWLQLFGEVTNEVCPGPPAALFQAKADMIAQSLQLGIAVARGDLPPLTAG